jgi:UDPglucose 6-dehydrogenase
MRDSSSLKMIPVLSKKGAKIRYFDPSGYKKDFAKIKNVSYVDSIKDSIDGSDLVIIHTEWNDFKSINFNKIVLNKKFILFDMRNIYSPSKMKDQKINYFGVGC